MLFFAIIDFVAKILAVQGKLPNNTFSFFQLSYFANPGIAFSIPLPQSLTLLITGALLVVFAALLVKTKHADIKIALTAAITGATSNFLDRLITGYTTDYFIFFSRSAINIADMLIIIGIGYCAWYYQKADEKKRVE